MKHSIFRSSRPASAQSSRGFTLVLALVMMGLLLMLVISTMTFLAVELRLTQSTTERLRARLVAMTSMRIAIAHVQQEAGPDQRVTAQANVTLPEGSWRKGENNPYWTGVWDSTNEKRPPAWLVSGKIQLHSLAGKTAYDNADYQDPWRTLAATDPDTIKLFVGGSNTLPGEPDIVFTPQVSIPRVAINAPDDTVIGHYAYFVADEGVKARFNLQSKNTAIAPSSAEGLARLMAPLRAAPELFSKEHWKDLNAEDVQQKLPRVLDTQGYASLDGMEKVVTADYFHAVTAHSQGVLSDVRFGGLKQDLSLAFEMKEADFNASFRNGTAPVSLNVKGNSDNGLGHINELNFNWEPVKMELAENSVAREARPVFNIAGGQYTTRGPTWEIMRNFYRLYKDEQDGGRNNFVNNALRARAFYPNNSSNLDIRPSRTGTFTYSHLYNVYAMTNGTDNPYVQDYGSWTNFGKRPRLFPTKAAIMPYTCRYILTLSLQAEPITGGKFQIRLVLNPIIVIHNPYNVPLALEGGATEFGPAGMRHSLRNAFYNVNISVDGVGKLTGANGDINNLYDTNVDAHETIRTYIPAMEIPPGEYRVFSIDNPKPERAERNVYMTTNNLYYDGGIYFDKLANGQELLEVEAGSKITVSIGFWNQRDTLQVREMINSWGIDKIDTHYLEGGGYYSYCTNHAELYVGNKESWSNSPIRNIRFEKTVDVGALPSSNAGTYPVAYADYFEKTTKWPDDQGSAGSSIYPMSRYNNNYPVFALSNPLAPVQLKDAQLYMWGYFLTSPSWQFRVGGKELGSWEQLLEMPNNGLAYGGYSLNSGASQVVALSLPRAPMTSLAQFQHANLNVVDHIPLFSAGHSIASPYVPADAVYEGGFWGWRTYDFTWLINTALWDRFYLSTIAPEVNPSVRGAPRQVRDQKAVWRDFIGGVGKEKKPLSNPTFVFNPYADRAKAETLLDDEKEAYRKSAAFVLQNGTFNVNGTDVRAWRSTLGSTHGIGVASADGGSVADATMTPFPHSVPSGVATFATGGSITDKSIWAGTKALTDDQIEKLAKSLVIKIRERFAHSTHKVDYSAPVGGEALSRPFFSLAEFVNRGANSTDDVGVLGVVQAALFHADEKSGAKINKDLVGDKTFTFQTANGGSGDGIAFRSAASVKYSEGAIPISAQAPGVLLQGDIMQAIGARLSVRSDTFLIRAYGDIADKSASGVAAKAWVEAVVQRTPEYFDPADDPDIAPEGDKDGRTLRPINRLFGRRFRVVSMRWLSPDEI